MKKLSIGEKNMKQLCKFLFVSALFLPSLGITSNLYTDEQCLTANVFFEARGESLKGMRAIADTTLNRTKHSAFKGQDAVCKVVFAKGQFSWTFQLPKKRIQRVLNADLAGFKAEDVSAYRKASEVAVQALNNEPVSRLPSWVVNFHTVQISPPWSNKMRYYATVGNHKFYGFKKKGSK